jgi:uncharacterized membrane protein
MNSLPLHPAIVHLPMGLALLMPLLSLGFAWALWTGRARMGAWTAVVVLQALLTASGFVAMKTGEAEEDRVEKVVRERAIHQHEEYAEQFVWGAAATLGLTALVLVTRRQNATRILSSIAVVATLTVAGLGLRVGHAGGKLVYVEGAASAYGTAPAAAAQIEPRGEHESEN